MSEDLLNSTVKCLIGLVQQGHIETIENMLDKHRNWDEINEVIGWAGDAAQKEYIYYIQQQLSESQAEVESLQTANESLYIESVQVEELYAHVERLREDLEEMACQWGDDYLFEKHDMASALRETPAISLSLIKQGVERETIERIKSSLKKKILNFNGVDGELLNSLEVHTRSGIEQAYHAIRNLKSAYKE